MSDKIQRSSDHPVLSPPGVPPGNQTRAKKATFWALLGASTILLALAVWVIWFLPSPNIASNSQTSIKPDHEDSRPPKAHQTRPSLQEATKARQRWYDQRAKAELQNISIWAGERYKQAISISDRALSSMEKGDFNAAVSDFLEASNILLTLIGDKAHILEQALTSGQAALEQGHSQKATARFNQALAIDPSNEMAKIGLKRAQTIKDVLEIFHKAKTEAVAGHLKRAHGMAVQALEIDPYFKPASKLLTQIEKRSKEQDFEKSLGTAISALAAGDFVKCRKHLERAARIRPGDEAVKELSIQLHTAEKQKSLSTFEAKAKRCCEKEDWAGAVALYERALSIDKRFLPALEGIEQAKRMLSLNNSLVEIISHPERLRDSGPLDDARKQVRIAMEIKNPGPLLAQRIQRASQVLSLATNPVPVTLLSDGQTQVTIFHVGRLGTFKNRTIALRPGKYILSGTRPGYRDVRVEFRVEAGKSHLPISITCEEKI